MHALIKMEIREVDVSLTEKEILLVILIRLLQTIQISFNQQMNLFENIRNWIFLEKRFIVKTTFLSTPKIFF